MDIETFLKVGGASEPRQVSTAKGGRLGSSIGVVRCLEIEISKLPVSLAMAGRPKAFIYKAVPNNDRLEADYSETLGSSQLHWSRPPPKQKKWSLAPGTGQKVFQSRSRFRDSEIYTLED